MFSGLLELTTLGTPQSNEAPHLHHVAGGGGGGGDGTISDTYNFNNPFDLINNPYINNVNTLSLDQSLPQWSTMPAPADNFANFSTLSTDFGTGYGLDDIGSSLAPSPSSLTWDPAMTGNAPVPAFARDMLDLEISTRPLQLPQLTATNVAPPLGANLVSDEPLDFFFGLHGLPAVEPNLDMTGTHIVPDWTSPEIQGVDNTTTEMAPTAHTTAAYPTPSSDGRTPASNSSPVGTRQGPFRCTNPECKTPKHIWPTWDKYQ